MKKCAEQEDQVLRNNVGKLGEWTWKRNEDHAIPRAYTYTRREREEFVCIVFWKAYCYPAFVRGASIAIVVFESHYVYPCCLYVSLIATSDCCWHNRSDHISHNDIVNVREQRRYLQYSEMRLLA